MCQEHLKIITALSDVLATLLTSHRAVVSPYLPAVALTTQQALSLGGVAMLLPGLVLEPVGHSYAWSPAWAGCVSPQVAGLACECDMSGRENQTHFKGRLYFKGRAKR
jgi:hypothetical protein